MERSARRRGFVVGVVALAALVSLVPRLTWAQNAAAQARPNILVIFGDDIGITNVSAYGHGVVGYRTPNINRLAKEGMTFTDYYAEQSCTAGRSAFITGIAPCAPASPRSARQARRSASRPRIRPSPNCLNLWATPPGNSGRTTSGIGTNTCRPCTASTSSSATSIT
jgi:Sulfatase